MSDNLCTELTCPYHGAANLAALREHYDNADTSSEMENGTWEVPDVRDDL